MKSLARVMSELKVEGRKYNIASHFTAKNKLKEL